MPPQMTAIVYGVSCADTGSATTVSMTVGGVDLGSDSINSNCWCNLCQEVEMDSGEEGEIATLQIWEWVVFVNVVLLRVAKRARNLNLTSPHLTSPHLISPQPTSPRLPIPPTRATGLDLSGYTYGGSNTVSFTYDDAYSYVKIL